MNTATLPANVDEVLGIGAFAPVLTADQQAAQDKLMADFLAVSRDHLTADDLFADEPFDHAAIRAQFGLSNGPRLDPIRARMASWANAGADNTRRAGTVLYSWDANPRVQQNGSVMGRIYAQPRGDLTRDVGAFKIDRDGKVLMFPAAARGDFPGVEGAKEAS